MENIQFLTEDQKCAILNTIKEYLDPIIDIAFQTIKNNHSDRLQQIQDATAIYNDALGGAYYEDIKKQANSILNYFLEKEGYNLYSWSIKCDFIEPIKRRLELEPVAAFETIISKYSVGLTLDAVNAIITKKVKPVVTPTEPATTTTV